MNENDGFLSRWSRRKAEVKAGRPATAEPVSPAPAAPAALPPVPDAAAPVSTLPASTDTRSALAAEVAPAEAPAAPAPPAPTLDDVAALLPGDEISRFVARGVDENVKRAALKKLFSDPRYNIMDGLDVYIDDYSKPDPIPMAMLRQMNQSKFLGLFADDEAQNAPAAQSPPVPAEAGHPPEPPVPTPDAESAPATAALPPATDEDADLQLQPDDAARRPGAATRPGTERG